MGKVIEIVDGPVVTETGVVGRVVKLSDGSGLIQSYGRKSGWKEGGTTLQSLFTAEAATREKLSELGFSDEQIGEILSGTDF